MRGSWLIVVALAATVSGAAFAAQQAKGTLTYKDQAKDYVLELKYAYLIKVPMR